MNYGLWMSAAGLSTEMHRQDVISNNLANAQTAGFKADHTFTRERPIAREELGLDVPSQLLLERLGGGVLAEPTWTNFAQGGFTAGGDLDLAISGSGFFVVRDGEGEAFTRDGGFTRGVRGELVDDDGRQVMSVRNRPIRLPETGTVSIGQDGTISVDGESIDRIRVAGPDTDRLRVRLTAVLLRKQRRPIITPDAMHLTGLFLYPVKSFRGCAVSAADVDAHTAAFRKMCKEMTSTP